MFIIFPCQDIRINWSHALYFYWIKSVYKRCWLLGFSGIRVTIKSFPHRMAIKWKNRNRRVQSCIRCRIEINCL